VVPVQLSLHSHHYILEVPDGWRLKGFWTEQFSGKEYFIAYYQNHGMLLAMVCDPFLFL